MQIQMNNKSSKFSFFYLFMLFFLTIGTRTIIERKYPILGSMELEGGLYLLADFLYFFIIGLVYLAIFYLFKKK